MGVSPGRPEVLSLVRGSQQSGCAKQKLMLEKNVGHVVPEARLGGPIALIRDGDRVVIDSVKRTIDWDVTEEEQARRRIEWEGSGKGTLTVKRGVLLRYARDVAVRGVSSHHDFQLRMDMPIYNSPQMWGHTVISMGYIYGFR